MRFLMILEVSQKQAYIFASTKLKDNIANSEAICQVTDPAYFKLASEAEGVSFDMEENVVYSGGGHTVLEFESEERAKDFAWILSRRVKKEFPKIELFIRTLAYNEEQLPGENLKRLSEALEVKKSVRAAAFCQKTFGVEKLQTNTRRPEGQVEGVARIPWPPKGEGENRWRGGTASDGVRRYPIQFSDLGNTENESSFIAVIHIDGNAMGKRVEELRRRLSEAGAGWEEYKHSLRRFSDAIDRDFKAAFKEMEAEILSGENEKAIAGLDLKPGMIPLRKIILAGDDVCFVSEGRIGLEAARIFIEKLSRRVNSEDGKSYAACAGVAIVHQKYPFYKAYELSESLCSSAKKYLASFTELDTEVSSHACAIDWHVEYGAGAASLGARREDYETMDGGRLELRPYLLEGATARNILDAEKIRRYGNFRRLIQCLGDDKLEFARGKLKKLREALREGEQTARYYMKSKLIADLASAGHMQPIEAAMEDEFGKLFTGREAQERLFVETADGKRRSLYFDAIELMDTFIGLKG